MFFCYLNFCSLNYDKNIYRHFARFHYRVVIIEQFFEGLRAIVREHDLLRHRYLQMAEQGKFSKDQIKAWALQEYFVSLSFPRMMAAVVTKIPDVHEAAKYPLVKNTYEELGADEGLKRSHPQLLRNLIRGLGGTEEELAKNKQNQGTKYYLDRLYEICLNRSFLEGLGAIGHGNEYLVIYEYGKFMKGMNLRGLLEPKFLEFFTVNIKADVEHTAEIEKAMASFLTPETMPLIEESAREALEARIPFYDDICSQLGI